jgi:hypothetical protein
MYLKKNAKEKIANNGFSIFPKEVSMQRAHGIESRMYQILTYKNSRTPARPSANCVQNLVNAPTKDGADELTPPLP